MFQGDRTQSCGRSGNERQQSVSVKLEALGFAEYFRTVVHGGYDAPAKPAPDPFRAALDALDAPPGRALHVGNSLSSDVAGARNAGLTAVWLENGAAPAHETGPDPDYVLSSMADLPGVVRA